MSFRSSGVTPTGMPSPSDRRRVGWRVRDVLVSAVTRDGPDRNGDEHGVDESHHTAEDRPLDRCLRDRRQSCRSRQRRRPCQDPSTHRVDDERVAVRPGVVATTPVVDVVARRRRVVRVALLDRDAGAAPLARAELAVVRPSGNPSLPSVPGRRV